MTIVRSSPSGEEVSVEPDILLDPNSVLGNPTIAVAHGVAVPVGLNTVLGRVAGNIVAAQLVSAQIGNNQITNPLLAPMPANTLKVNISGANLTPQDLVVGTNTVVGRVAGNIAAAQLVGSQIAAATIPNAALATMAANTIKANATAIAAVPQDFSVPVNTVVGRAAAGNIVAAQIVAGQIGNNQIANAALAQMPANTIKVNATAALADPQDLAVGLNTVVGRGVAGDIVAAPLVNTQILAGGAGTVKGTAITGGSIQDLSGSQLSENLLYSTVVNVAGASGTLDIVVTAATTVVAIAATGNCVLRSLTALAAGKELRIYFNPTPNTLTLTIINQGAGATLQQLSLPQARTRAYGANASFILFQESSNWRLRADTPGAAITLSVAVPVLAANTLGYVDVSLVGTAFEGLAANSPLYAQPQADLAAAAAAGGFYVGCRVSATSTLRFTFYGTLAGGATNFLVTLAG